MTYAEHLIENTIDAMQKGKDVMKVLSEYPNDLMINATRIQPLYLYQMASHVVFSLYDGEYPHFWSNYVSTDSH